MLRKRQVMAEGYRKGLERALEVITEAIQNKQFSAKGMNALNESSDNEPEPLSFSYNDGKTTVITNNEFERMTKHSRQISSPIGSIVMSNEIAKHTNNHNRENANARKKVFLFALRTLSHPIEVRYNKGKYVFLAQYNITNPANGTLSSPLGMAVIVEKQQNGGLIMCSFYSSMSKQGNFWQCRQGRVVYSKKG